MKPVENWSSGFREDYFKRLHDFIHVNIPRARAPVTNFDL